MYFWSYYWYAIKLIKPHLCIWDFWSLLWFDPHAMRTNQIILLSEFPLYKLKTRVEYKSKKRVHESIWWIYCSRFIHSASEHARRQNLEHIIYMFLLNRRTSNPEETFAPLNPSDTGGSQPVKNMYGSRLTSLKTHFWIACDEKFPSCWFIYFYWFL